jgi:hypothetical protein
MIFKNVAKEGRLNGSATFLKIIDRYLSVALGAGWRGRAAGVHPDSLTVGSYSG